MGIKDNYRGPAGKVLPGLQLELTAALSRLKKLETVLENLQNKPRFSVQNFKKRDHKKKGLSPHIIN